MDDLITAFQKALGVVCLWCGILIVFFVCLIFTTQAFVVSPFLGFVALFVDAVIVATLHYYSENKKPTVGK